MKTPCVVAWICWRVILFGAVAFGGRVVAAEAAAGSGLEAGRTWIVATKESPPFAMKASDGRWTGLSIELWEKLAETLNLKYEYRELDLASLLDRVTTGEADLGLAALTITSEREASMDFTHPYYQGGLGVAVGRRSESMVWSLFRNVFSKDFLSAVLALGAVLLAAAVAVWLFERRANPEQFGGSTSEGLGASFWWSAVTMTTVGYGDKAPQSVGGRVVAVIWMFTSVIIISSFTAGIASSVTVNRIATDVLRSRPLQEMTVATVDQSSSYGFAVDHGYRVQPYADLDEALAAVEEGRAQVVLYDLPILKYHLIKNPALKLDILPQVVLSEEYAIALPPGSPLREPLNVEIPKATRTTEWQDLRVKYLGE